jgi:hypothetical protein
LFEKELDLIFQDAPCLELLIQQLLPRQANQVKSIAIGLHHDSDELFPAKQLRQILEICTNLTKLSVRLESARLNEHGNFIIDPWHPISRLLDPISQLSNLTHLTLLNYNNNCVLLDEEFVVKIIKRMVHLVYIRLDRVDATNATCDFCDCEASNQPSLSPLAVHLASLSSLKFIYFTAMPCFDSGWSKIKWKGALEGITLRKTPATLGAVHAFCNMFPDSLVFISLYLSPILTVQYKNVVRPADLECDLFRLPNLKRVSFCSSHAYMLLNLFAECKNIFRISLMNIHPFHLSLQDIKCLINHHHSSWPHLKSLLIHTQKGWFTREERSGFTMDGLKVGIKVECGSLKKVRQPFFEEDNFSTDGDRTEFSSSDSESEGTFNHSGAESSKI